MALDTVKDYVTEARVLLQDTIEPYRYPTADFVTALNLAMLASKRLRPDLWIGVTMPSFTAVSTTSVPVDELYRTAVLYLVCGNIQLRDEEEEQDTRALGFQTKGANILMGLAA